MDHARYIKNVKERALLARDRDAAKTIGAVLEVLGERLSIGEARDLAALLPVELKSFIRDAGPAEPFGLNEFLARVAAREGITPIIARYHAQAVLSVLAEDLPRNELINALAELPNEIRDLFLVQNWIKHAA